MDDIKRTYREGEETAKEELRKSDADESLADKVGNVGDDIRKNLGNAGDTVGERMDDEDTAEDRPL